METSTTTKMKPSNDDIARMIAKAATQQLRGSERGAQALRDFKALLDNGGYGLDSENWNALTDLCKLGAVGKEFALDEQFCGRRREWLPSRNGTIPNSQNK